MIEHVDAIAAADQASGQRGVAPAVLGEPVRDDHHGAQLALRQPGLRVKLRFLAARQPHFPVLHLPSLQPARIERRTGFTGPED